MLLDNDHFNPFWLHSGLKANQFLATCQEFSTKAYSIFSYFPISIDMSPPKVLSLQILQIILTKKPNNSFEIQFLRGTKSCLILGLFILTFWSLWGLKKVKCRQVVQNSVDFNWNWEWSEYVERNQNKTQHLFSKPLCSGYSANFPEKAKIKTNTAGSQFWRLEIENWVCWRDLQFE